MKVDNSVAKITSVVVNDGVGKKPELPKEPQNRHSTSSDEVSISDLVRNLRELVEADETSSIRSEKIARVKAEINAGTYTVSGEAVAEKMLGVSTKK